MQLEVELVQCVMLLLNKPQGLITLEASSELLPLLAVSVVVMSCNISLCISRKVVLLEEPSYSHSGYPHFLPHGFMG